ncbi:MAG: alpha/beta hydrolase, partial [Betaproteobacteria bacterium]|nr:alpha/beta hydrolase [Betaproteobacteria bacterium]
LNPMPSVTANHLTLEYESLGNDSDPPLLLIMGMAMQLVGWPDAFCHKLVQQGFRVIRFDNRDMGLSTSFDHLGHPNVPAAFGRYLLRLPLHPPYLIDDMADDAAGLIDALNLGPTHIVGVSMGGMIGQSLTARYPEKIRSLTSIMSSTGRRSLPPPTWKTTLAMLEKPARRDDLEGAIDRLYRALRLVSGPIKDSDEFLRAHSERHVRRYYNPAASARHLLAVSGSGDRSKTIAQINKPTLVIHGAADPLLPPEHGRETARLIPNARFNLIDGMGHTLPAPLHERLTADIAAHCRAAS